jgi:hypothetical protein
VPASVSGFSLGSVSVIERATRPASDTAASDPLRLGDMLLLPSLGAPIEEQTRPELPVHVSLRTEATDSVEIGVELRRGEAVLAAAKPALPAPDAEGRVVWLGGIPAARLTPGSYEIVVSARQGAVTAEERTAVEITPGRQAVVIRNDEPVADPVLRALLERAGRYVAEYETSFRDIVAEETYTQRTSFAKWLPSALPSPPTQFEDGTLQIRTRADVAFVRLAGEIPWGVFRDVFEVNGVKVRDRDGRLEKILTTPSASSLEQARRILDESSRFNMGVWRTINIPTLPLLFLHPANQRRFTYRLGGKRKFDAFEGIEIQFREVAAPSIVRTLNGESVPVQGKFWVEPNRGAVLRSETQYGETGPYQPDGLGIVTTTYRAEPALQIFVPEEMKERYSGDGGAGRQTGRAPTEAAARYSNLRRFEVRTESETLVVPPR